MQAHEISTIIQNVSVTLASLVAIFGIDAWRREYVGKRQMELAEEVLSLFYQVRDAIPYIRSSIGFAGEGSTRKVSEDETPLEKEALDRAYVLFERYEKHAELFSRLRALRYRFMAQVGESKSKPFNDLDSVIKEMFSAARQLGRFWSQERGLPPNDKERERYQKAESVFWDGSEPDPIQPKVDALVSHIEGTCKAILASKGTLFGIINLRVSR